MAQMRLFSACSYSKPPTQPAPIPLPPAGPGVPKGVQLPHLVGNVDFVPTWLELAGGVQKGGFLLCPRLILLWAVRFALRMH